MHARGRFQTARLQDVMLALGGVLAFVFSNIAYKRMSERRHPLVLTAASALAAHRAESGGRSRIEECRT